MKPDNLVALHHQMTGSYVVKGAPAMVTQPLDWWALNLIEGLQRDRERLIAALRDAADTAEGLNDEMNWDFSEDAEKSVLEWRALLTELEANDAGSKS